MEPYPVSWRRSASGTGQPARLSAAGHVQGVAGLSGTPNLDALMAENARARAALAGVSGTRTPDAAALRRLATKQIPRWRLEQTRALQAMEANARQKGELERLRLKHGIQRGGYRHHSRVPQSMMPLARGALGGVRFPMRHPALNMLKMSLNILEWIQNDLEPPMTPMFNGYSITNECQPWLAVPPYLGREIMADLTSGAACLLLQAIAENPLPALPASAPTVGFSTYVQGPFGRWATLATYAPVAAPGPALAAGPVLASDMGWANPHNMVDALSAAGGWPANRPLPLALNAALARHNPMRAPGEQNERGYGVRTQTDPRRARPPSGRYGPADKKGRSRWHKSGKVGVVWEPAFPRPYSPEMKALRLHRAVMTLIGQVTEMLDHVDALYKALPESIRKRIAARFAVNNKPVSLNAKIWALLIHWKELDGGQAVYNLVYNAVTDRLQAQASKAGVKLSAQYGARPTMLTPSRAGETGSELPHGSVSGAAQAVLQELNVKAPGTADYLRALNWLSAQSKSASFRP